MHPPHRELKPGDLTSAQQSADCIRLLREELASQEIQSVLALTPEQQGRFEEWSRAKLASLAQQFDVDTSASQKRASWAMRIASTLGALALCVAVILFFMRYWGYLATPVQVTIVVVTPLILLAGTEFASHRERTKYFTGLLALVTVASFILNLVVVGDIFNITSTERALLAWGAFAIVLAYRYGLRLLLAIGLLLLTSYAAAAFTAQWGYHWLEFYNRPEQFLLLGLILFALPLWWRHSRQTEFPSVYRLVGALTFFIAVLSLADWGEPSYLPWNTRNIERFYEFFGLISSAGAIWWGIRRNQSGMVNTGATFFVIFLFTRLYHWWWDWMPRFLFFAVIGALGIAVVALFKRVRSSMVHFDAKVPA